MIVNQEDSSITLQASDVHIDIEKLLKANLKKAIDYVKLNDNIAQNLHYHIENEQIFFNSENEDEDLVSNLDLGVNPNTMFIVYRRGSASTLFDNVVTPYSIYAFVNNAYIETAQRILDAFAENTYIPDDDRNSGNKYGGNLQIAYTTYVDSETGKPITVPTSEAPSGASPKIYSWLNQTFDKASVFNNMIPAGTQYFVSLTMSTTFVVCKDINGLQLDQIEYYPDGLETESTKILLPVMQATISFNIEHDSQPFYKDTNSQLIYEFPISDAKWGSLVLSLMLPMKNNAFTKALLEIANFKYLNDASAANINKEFILKYSFLDGEFVYYNKFKLASFNYIKTLGEGDSYTVSLTT